MYSGVWAAGFPVGQINGTYSGTLTFYIDSIHTFVRDVPVSVTIREDNAYGLSGSLSIQSQDYELSSGHSVGGTVSLTGNAPIRVEGQLSLTDQTLSIWMSAQRIYCLPKSPDACATEGSGTLSAGL